ncbi:CcmD family protein [Desulfovibrio sp. QI0434]
MDTLTWVIMANAAVWIGIGSYMAFLAARQRSLAARLVQMEMLNHD